MARAARSQSRSVFSSRAPLRKPSGKTTVIGPVASRTTCQLVTTRPCDSSTATSAPVPSDAPFCSAAIIRTTAGWGSVRRAQAVRPSLATAGQSATRTVRRFFTRHTAYRGAGQRVVIPALRRCATWTCSNPSAGGKGGDVEKLGKVGSRGGSSGHGWAAPCLSLGQASEGRLHSENP